MTHSHLGKLEEEIQKVMEEHNRLLTRTVKLMVKKHLESINGETNEAATNNRTSEKNIQTSLDLPKELEGSWGAEESSSEDIIVPKILLMHGQSKLVLKASSKLVLLSNQQTKRS